MTEKSLLNELQPSEDFDPRPEEYQGTANRDSKVLKSSRVRY